MRASGELLDMVALARLHAALDSVVETQHEIAAIHQGSAIPPPGVTRVSELLGEAHELLRGLLKRPENRQAVGSTTNR
jgi:hypothetical protein